MQKKETDKLYIAGLNIVTDIEYKNDKELIHSKFLKWIVVENTSSDYTTEFVDIKTDTKYYQSVINTGELFVDLKSLISMNSFTNKSKLSTEDCCFILEQFKKDYEVEKQERKKASLEIIENYSETFDEEGNIIIETLAKYGDEVTTVEEAFDIISDSLEITKKGKVRKR